ncbi:MAG: acyltransferase [Bacteroidaceae bacterium]|nr:acyltransferase [Bacteroidaceae bacterium]
MSSIFHKFRETSLGSCLGGMRTFWKEYCVNYRKKFGYCHPTATVTRPLVVKGPQNVFLYEDTKITNAVIMTPVKKFIMKKHSSAVEGLKVITGNHERRVGRFFRTIGLDEKAAGLEGDVIVEEDCWIGVNVTLLMGVTVRRGSTVAAGAVVSKSTPPYSINGGIPCKFIKFYWTIDQILEHEAQLYPEEERYTREQLQEIFAKYQNKK